MRATSIAIRRLLPVLVALAVTAALAPAASAAITATSITTPIDPYQTVLDFQNGMGPYSVHVIGATTGSVSGDKVELRCYRNDPHAAGPSYTTVDSNVALAADGTFDTFANANSLGYALCRLRAVPVSAGNPADVSAFTGPRVYKSELSAPNRINAGRNAGVHYDFYYSTTDQGRTGFMDFDSLGGCGLDQSHVFDPTSDVRGYQPFNCNGYLYYRDGGSDATSTRSQLQIDGHNAYNSASAERLFSANAGLPPLTVSATRDPATGNLTIDESEDIVRCATDTFPATALSCPSFLPTGVRFFRHIVMRSSRVVDFYDAWRSTDGQAHALSTLFENDFAGTQAGFSFPWADGTAYATHIGTDTKPGAPGTGPVSMFVKSDNAAADGSLAAPQGAITVSTPPNSVRFTADPATDPSSTFLLGFNRAIPAGGTFSMIQTFSQGVSTAEVTALAQQAADRQVAPNVSISSPSNHASASSATLTVRGTATDNVGVSSLTVNGAATAVGAGGAFSRSVHLTKGANTITAIVHDGQGNAAQATVTVTYRPPARCIVPRLRGKTLRAARGALGRAHCRTGSVHHVSVTVPKTRQARKHSLLGKVIKSSPGPGRSLTANSKVALYVGVAKKHGKK